MIEMTPLMSFWLSIYEKMADQIKLTEYRRNFPKDCKIAYMYVSKPVKAICGIIYFGDKHRLLNWKEIYSDSLEISTRIEGYLKDYRYGIEVKAFQKIEPITLEGLRENIRSFVAPQSYILLENNKGLAEYIESSIVLIGEKIENDFSNAYPEHVCKRY